MTITIFTGLFHRTKNWWFSHLRSVCQIIGNCLTRVWCSSDGLAVDGWYPILEEFYLVTYSNTHMCIDMCIYIYICTHVYTYIPISMNSIYMCIPTMYPIKYIRHIQLYILYIYISNIDQPCLNQTIRVDVGALEVWTTRQAVGMRIVSKSIICELGICFKYIVNNWVNYSI